MSKCKCGQTDCCKDNTIEKKIHQAGHGGEPEYIDGEPVYFLRKECTICGSWQGDTPIESTQD